MLVSGRGFSGDAQPCALSGWTRTTSAGSNDRPLRSTGMPCTIVLPGPFGNGSGAWSTSRAGSCVAPDDGLEVCRFRPGALGGAPGQAGVIGC